MMSFLNAKAKKEVKEGKKEERKEERKKGPSVLADKNT